MNQSIQKEKWIFEKMFFVFGILVIMLVMSGKTVEAATTCKSLMSYPAKTTAKVNMRRKAGTNYKSYGMLNRNTEVTLLGYAVNKKQTWYKCKGKVNGKTKTGYVHASYIKKLSKPTGIVNKKVTSTLNVRSSAKTSAKVLIKIPKKTKVTVLGIKKVSGKYWYKIKVTYKKNTKTGYVLSTYIDVKKESTGDTSSNQPIKETEEKVMLGYVNNKVTTSLNVRNEASVKSAVLISIPPKTLVSVLGTTGDWYKVKVTYNKKKVTGYAAKTYITIGTLDSSTNNNSNTDDGKNDETKPNEVTDKTFETLLQNFPESYKSSLRALHNEYPNWTFVAMNTNLDWNTVIQNESVVGRNVIQSNYPKGTASLSPFSYLSTASGAYNWSTDAYVVKDGSNWYSANSAVIAYYMDPRNFLNSNDIFQFEALAYDTSQSDTVVQSILSNTFMKGDYSVYDSTDKKTVTGSYKQAFMDAGVSAKANPYFLASRCKQEVGANGSNSTSGTYKGYEGIYNFYNIGAFDGGNAVAKGLQWARTGTSYLKPWTNPYKSIVGGAQYIAANYINKGQNTLYLQKFNVMPTDASNLYLHQYMTNVQAPYSEGKTTRNAYNTLGILKDAMVFYIPVYNNMPASACKLPEAKGNPNPFLASIKVYNGSTALSGLAPTFSKPGADGALSNNTYSIVVPASLSKVTIKASAISKYATVSGTGTFDLNAAGTTTTFTVTGIAQNGTKQSYVVEVYRKDK